jgi:CYTH domain-containing protein
MAREIERKFLIDRLPEEIEGVAEEEVAQGYLATGDDEVRVRRRGNGHVLTVKQGAGLSRVEVEVPLERAAFDELWPLTEGRRVEKTRRTTTIDGHKLEVDVYRGPLAGLITAEVEFHDDATASAFSPPLWVSRELTGDGRYSNQRLALEGLPAG